MGNTISLRVRHAFAELLSILRTFLSVEEHWHVSLDPGLPIANSTRSFWMFPPSSIARHCSELPRFADIVVIGSGITGTSVARTFLDGAHAHGESPVLLMLEARDVCSGATGRNGGHVSPPVHQDFNDLRQAYGVVAAQKITAFRLAHVQEFRRVAKEEGILEQSQWRQVEAVDAYFNQELFERAKAELRTYLEACPSEAAHHGVHEAREATQKYSLASDVVGCITSSAAAIHPYRFVTGILSKLLNRYPKYFFLCTNTPCTSILAPSASEPLYTIVTTKGLVKTPHVVHATNAWSSHLLAPMRNKIIPIRGHMTAQRPGQSLPPSTSQRSFTFYEIPGAYDYLTQMPHGEHELMLGAAFAPKGPEAYRLAVTADDSEYNARTGAHLSGALPRYFGADHWGREGLPPPPGEGDSDTRAWFQGRVKATWSGIIGVSADRLPWVGRLSASMTGRSPPPSNLCLPSKGNGTIPGEWIAAGYTGEGMVQAWLSGKALAEMIMGREHEANVAEWFPANMRVSTARWKGRRPT